MLSLIHNYIKIAWRNFYNSKAYSFINLGGLSLGMCSCLLISLYVIKELKTKSAVVFPAAGPALKEEFPEVLAFTRILPFGQGVYSRKNKSGSLICFNETKAVLGDENFSSGLVSNCLQAIRLMC